MVLLYVILFVVLLVVGLLFVPMKFFVDTSKGTYYASLQGLAKASLELDQEVLLRVRLKVFFLERCYYPLKKSKKVKKSSAKKTVGKSKIRLGKLLRVLKTFKVQRFSVDMDTGDYTLNAKLYPIFMFLDRRVGSFHINFHDCNRLVLDVRNRPYRILKSFINH